MGGETQKESPEMIYTIIIQPPAEKDLAALPIKDQAHVNEKIALLAEDPRPLQCKKLKDHNDEYRLRVGSYRVLYKIDDRKKLVFIARVKRRNEATYK